MSARTPQREYAASSVTPHATAPETAPATVSDATQTSTAAPSATPAVADGEEAVGGSGGGGVRISHGGGAGTERREESRRTEMSPLSDPTSSSEAQPRSARPPRSPRVAASGAQAADDLRKSIASTAAASSSFSHQDAVAPSLLHPPSTPSSSSVPAAVPVSSSSSPPIPPRSPLRPPARPVAAGPPPSSFSAPALATDALALGPDAAMPLLHSRSFGSLSTLLDPPPPAVPTRRPRTPDGASYKPLPLTPQPSSHSSLSFAGEREDEDDATLLAAESAPRKSAAPVMSKRQHALAELLDSERAYASDLALVRNVHLPLALGASPSFPSPSPSSCPRHPLQPPLNPGAAAPVAGQPLPFDALPASPPGSSASSSRTLSTASDFSANLGGPPPMTPDDARIIFNNIAELAQFSDGLVDDLEVAIGASAAPAAGGAPVNADDRVGELFLDVVSVPSSSSRSRTWTWAWGVGGCGCMRWPNPDTRAPVVTCECARSCNHTSTHATHAAPPPGPVASVRGRERCVGLWVGWAALPEPPAEFAVRRSPSLLRCISGARSLSTGDGQMRRFSAFAFVGAAEMHRGRCGAPTPPRDAGPVLGLSHATLGSPGQASRSPSPRSLYAARRPSLSV